MTYNIESHYASIIDGKEVDNGIYFDSIAPATGNLLCTITKGNQELVDKAVDSASIAQKKWAKTTYEMRSLLLNKLADKIEENIHRLAYIDALDVGRRVSETIIDYRIAIEQYRYFAGAILTYEGNGRPIPNGYFVAKQMPIGVVGQIIPWNVPAIMVALKIAPAIAAGNAVVLKPDENASISTLEFGKLANSIFPPGLINIVPGYGQEVGSAITGHDGISKLAFTGSPEVGRIIGKAGAERLVPVSLELGGKSPNIVFPDIDDIDAVVDNVVFAFTYCNGQSCLAGTRLFLHEDIYDIFIEKLRTALAKLKIGDPLDPETKLSCIINAKQGEKILSFIEQGKSEGARLLFGGNRVQVANCQHGYFIEPTVFAVDNDMTIAQQEIFGPVLCVLKWSSYDALIQQANDVKYGLAAGIYTTNLANAHQTADDLETGNVWINKYFNVNSGCPFGGVKESGIGREHCHETLNAYSHTKTITIQNKPDMPWFV